MEWLILDNQINEEIGLGRTRSEINVLEPKEFDEETHFPSIEEEAIFNELGLGKNDLNKEIFISEHNLNSNQ